MSCPSFAPSTARSFSLRSPREKYVSTCRNDPRRSAPERSARALPRSSYRAFSSTRYFAPVSTRSENASWTRRFLWLRRRRTAMPLGSEAPLRSLSSRPEGSLPPGPIALPGPSVARDPPLASQVRPEHARSPPVLQRKAQTPSQFDFGVVEAREACWFRSESCASQFAIPPDAKGHPIVVDLHEDDGARLTAAGLEMLQHRQAGRVVRPCDLVRIGRPASREFMVVGRRRVRLQVPRLESLEHERLREHQDRDVVRESARARYLDVGDPRERSDLADEALRQDIVDRGDRPLGRDEPPPVLRPEQADGKDARDVALRNPVIVEIGNRLTRSQVRIGDEVVHSPRHGWIRGEVHLRDVRTRAAGGRSTRERTHERRLLREPHLRVDRF